MRKDWKPPVQWVDADSRRRTLIAVVKDGGNRLVASKRHHPKKRQWDYILEPDFVVDFHITKLSKYLNKQLEKTLANLKKNTKKPIRVHR